MSIRVLTFAALLIASATRTSSFSAFATPESSLWVNAVAPATFHEPDMGVAELAKSHVHEPGDQEERNHRDFTSGQSKGDS